MGVLAGAEVGRSEAARRRRYCSSGGIVVRWGRKAEELQGFSATCWLHLRAWPGD